jgi:hypothetical protein
MTKGRVYKKPAVVGDGRPLSWRAASSAAIAGRNAYPV